MSFYRERYCRGNGSSTFTREDWLPSTATPLGEIEVSAAMSEEAQLAEVRNKALAWLEERDEIADDAAAFGSSMVLLAGYESYRLDTNRPFQYNRISCTSGCHGLQRG